ncbi:hypothetical protein P1T57_25320, partial [Escherichia coli]|nr:hypothetical protein [Escherichia coli]
MKKSEKQTRILQKAAYFYYYCVADTFIMYSALVSKISSIFPCSFSALRCGFFISDFDDLLKNSENFVGGCVSSQRYCNCLRISKGRLHYANAAS